MTSDYYITKLKYCIYSIYKNNDKLKLTSFLKKIMIAKE